MFPIIPNDENLNKDEPVKWTSIGKSFSIPKKKKPKKKKKIKRTQKKRKQQLSEKQKILLFEKRRIKIDPRSIPSINNRSNFISNSSNDIFDYDLKGDNNNIIFGSTYRKNIPKYTRNPNCQLSVLLSSHFSTENDRYFKGLKAMKWKKIKKFTRITQMDTPITENNNDDFIPFKKHILIEEKFVDYIYRKKREYNEKIYKNPKILNSWLEFVLFQDEFFELEKINSFKTIMQKKASIFEAALKFNQNNTTILLGCIKCYAKILSHEETDKKYYEILKKNTQNVDLWYNYFLFKKSIFSEFSVSTMRKVFVFSLGSLLSEKKKTNFSNIQKVIEIEEKMLGLFLQCLFFEIQCGYVEKSIAMLQALLEINIFCPIDIFSWAEQVEKFKIFWEAELERVGENNSKGWKNCEGCSVPSDEIMDESEKDFMELNRIIEEKMEEENEIDTIIDDKEVFFKWVVDEKKRSAGEWRPCKPIRDEKIVESNPDRAVLFEDISDYLFPITSVELRKRLVYIFIEFLGVPILSKIDSTNDVLFHEFLISKEESKDLLSVFEKKFEWKSCNLGNIPEEKRNFIRNLFKLVLNVFPNDSNLLLSYLEFEDNKKITQKFVKKQAGNLLLWELVAKNEQKSGNPKKCLTVYENVLLHSTGDNFEDIVFFWRSFVEYLLFIQQDKNYALHVICCFVEYLNDSRKFTKQIDISPVRVLQTKKNFQKKIKNHLQKPQNERINDFILIFGLFEYITIGNLNFIKNVLLKDSFWPNCMKYHPSYSVIEVLLNVNKIVDYNGVVGGKKEENLWVSYFRYEIALKSIPKYDFQEILKRFLARFPCNPIGISILINLEDRLLGNTKMRFFLSNHTSKYPSPATFLYAIYNELLKKNSENNVRSLFEKALEFSICKSNIMLWRMYIRFEITQNNMKNAKKIFYRAIDKVPNSKNLWLDSIILFKDHLQTKDVKDIYNLMLNKEICLKSQIEDFLD